jgi:hypothetical protein
MSLLLIILLVIILAGAVPAYPYNKDWGYGPAGLILLIVVILLITGNLRLH